MRAEDRQVVGPYFAGGFVVASLALFLLGTRHGIGIFPDSVAYMRLGVARHFAPLYTWYFLAASTFGADVVAAAKWLGFLLAGLNTALVWRILVRATDSPTYAATGTALVVLHPVFVEMHASAMTEPLFLTLLFVALLMFARALDDGRDVWFAAIGAVIGLAMLTRFAAAPILAAFCAYRLLHADRPLALRLYQCFWMGAVCLAVFGGWMAASELTGGGATGRAFAFRGHPDKDFWLGSLQSFSILLSPAPVPSALRLGFLTVALGAAIWCAAAFGRGWRRAPAGEPLRKRTFPGALGFFAVAYAAFLLLSVYIQPYLPLNGRMLLPLYVAAVLATTIMARHLAADAALPKGARVGLALLAAVLLIANLARSAAFTAAAFANGVGYASTTWGASPILRIVANLPPEAVVYSNAPDVITYRLRRDAEYLPSKINHLTGVEDPNRPFAMQMEEMRERLSRPDAFVAFVDGVGWRYYLATEDELVAKFALVKVADAADGRLYRGR
jgi:4-amino-4-deoxy-L-arabinose transferase-like glycosyltransferase